MMELQSSHSSYVRRQIPKSRPPAVRWLKEWVPQDVIGAGGKLSLLKWVREDVLNVLNEKAKEAESKDLEPESNTEVLFLCSYEGCGKTFIDAGAIRKHAHVHGERQYVCNYEGCGRKFLDSSKLKRHFLIHTGERDFVCPHEGCGKAFSLDFNLRAHLKTHSLENYHICPFKECGKRYTNESKLRSHMKSHHEKNTIMETVKHTPTASKIQTTPKTPALAYGSASSDRPYVCPYEGCGKDYIHEYKLNLHLRREHPGHNPEDNSKHAPAAVEHDMDEASDQDAYHGKGSGSKNLKRKPKLMQKMPPSKVANRKGSGSVIPASASAAKKPWPSKPVYEEDSEETEEEEQENGDEEGWRYREAIGDDEETEDED